MSYQTKWIGYREQILKIAEKAKSDYPAEWNEVKIPGQKSRKFINLVSLSCLNQGIPAGVNMKRGGPEESLDALALPNDTGARDSTGTYAGVEIVDIIGAAESPNANLGWSDVTQVTIDSGNPGGWKAGSLSQPAPPQTSHPVPGREEALDEMKWLDAYYAAPEGLQRPNGLSLNGKPDFEGIAAWYLDIYQQERIKGKSRTDARAAYVSQIRHSDEWKAKHPGEQP